MRARLTTALDRGDTLIELVLAVAILGVAAVTIVGALTLSVRTSDIHRREATASASVRDYAEAIEKTVSAGGYVTGAGPYPAYTAPTGYVASLTSKQCWTGATWTNCTGSTDAGVQQLTLQVASTNQRAVEKLVIVVRKPCAPGQTTCT